MKQARRGWLAQVGGITWLFLALATLAILSTAGQILGFYTDWLWFHEVQFTSVFLTVLETQVLLGAVTGAAFFLIFYGNVMLARRLASREVLVVVDDTAGLPSPEVLDPYLRRLTFPSSVMIALFVGWLGADRWELVLKALNPTPFGIQDPLFGQEVAFYVFQLPLWNSLYGWLMGSLVVSGLAATAVHFATRGIQISPTGLSISPRARAHLLALAALLLLLKVAGYRLAMFDLLFTQRGVVFGAGYADVHAQLPILKALMVLAGLVGVLCLVTIRLRSWRPLLWGLAALVGVAVLGGGVYPALIQRYRVSPNEIDKEKPYIDFNIRYTRLAYGLDNIEEREFPAEETLTLQDLRKNEATLKNIRLWDTRPLLATYSQLQEIRTYYKFTDIDIDRYRVNGEYRQVTLSPRELSSKDLPSRIWINERLTYTHGYGAVVGPVNRVTREGLPEFWIKDIPPGASTDLRISRPELYFSELTTDYVFVKTRAKEFNYPAGDQNVYTVYEGQGGIPLQSLWRKVLLAAHLGDIKLLMSNDLTTASRVLLYRNIRERVQRIAPFFRYDDDPYMVISAAGHIVWLLDGYTLSDWFPYSTATRGLGNYVRNAVKVTVDAYDGTVHFYVADPADPLIRTTARIFPGLLRPLDAMPADLRAHIRYPEGLFRVQAAMYAVYHMRDTQVFYNKEDLWSIPIGHEGGANLPMEPYYLIMRLPGEPKEEFVLLIPFNPSKKDNLSAWLAARSDPPHYGKLVVYNFPKQKLIYGPRQIEARIDQDSFISQQLTLWNQRGSQVVRGNLLVIPIERSLVYVEPLYIAAEKGQLPELKRVIVGFGDRIAMEETLDGAMARVFGGPVARAGSEVAPTPPLTATGPAKTLLDAAAAALARANDELRRLSELLRQLREESARESKPQRGGR
ncbi:MAG TPA: UPF0182 family protein [Candidatus Bathyarchaeia archaeon]|nr:UPF0182 family protein [Candidatus Bathyarchaeia archaeon]